jgi:hypothetical protein
MKRRISHPPGRHPKRVLAVRVLLPHVAWLDGRLEWLDGRVVWNGADGPFAPHPPDLARAQRTLHKIDQYPISAGIALGDRHAWLAERQARLEEAKGFSTVREGDLVLLERECMAGNRRAFPRMAALVSLEAACVNDLPVSPCRVLARCDAQGERQLRRLIKEAGSPAVRAISALALGSMVEAGRVPFGFDEAGWDTVLKSAHVWGATYGMPDSPSFLAALLAEDDGPDLAGRYDAASRNLRHFPLRPAKARALMTAGMPAREVVEAVEGLLRWEPIAERLSDIRDALPETGRHAERRAEAERLQAERKEAIGVLRSLVSAYLGTTRDPKVINLLADFVERMLSLDTMLTELVHAIRNALKPGLDLPVALCRSYAGLLADYQARIWAGERPDKSHKPLVRSRQLRGWLEERWGQVGKPLLALLRQCGDEKIVREAVEAGLPVAAALSTWSWTDPALYRFALRMNRLMNPHHGHLRIFELMDELRTVQACRRLLTPLDRAVEPAEPSVRAEVFGGCIFGLRWQRQELYDGLPRLTKHVPRLISARGDSYPEDSFDNVIRAALTLDRCSPEQAPAWIDAMTGHLAASYAVSDEAVGAGRIVIAARVAARVAQDDMPRFVELFGTVVRREMRGDVGNTISGIDLVVRIPALRRALAMLWPRQPDRCAELVERMGLTRRLGEAAGPLDALRVESLAALDDDWLDLLVTVPEASQAVTDYLQARQVLNLSPGIPPAVRRASDLPARLAAERDYLRSRERLDAGLAGRLRVLDERLEDGSRLIAEVRKSVRERLAHAAAEAQLQTAEWQTLACFRARLEDLTGPAPEALEMGPDLLNAILLTTDISENRRLLLRLLCAHVTGDRGWRDNHPENVHFLTKLATSGIDADCWQAEHPHTYRFPHAANGRVLVRLERDPLAILQMGNHFGTCLSFGDINAFSTVANACELNKRVVFAYDGAGRVVGRKLVGINSQGALVGFHTYTSLTDEAGNKALRRLIDSYAMDFATRCGLELADDGEIPRLLAQDWYDDGVVPWRKDAPAGRQKGRTGQAGGEIEEPERLKRVRVPAHA